MVVIRDPLVDGSWPCGLTDQRVAGVGRPVLVLQDKNRKSCTRFRVVFAIAWPSSLIEAGNAAQNWQRAGIGAGTPAKVFDAKHASPFPPRRRPVTGRPAVPDAQRQRGR